jgi:Na+-translocating ferredoxin:NAD+ oxidoreductase subunit A
MQDLIIGFFSAVFVNNILLVKYLGNCPFCGVSKNIESSLGMGIAVTFVITIASSFTWAVDHFMLKPLDLQWLQTIVFILIIATLVQMVEMFMKKNVISLYQSLGIYLPLITTNCAVLGVAIISVREEYGFVKTLMYSFSSSVGFLLALLCMAGIRQRLELVVVPKPFAGIAITLVIAGIMALAFYGFSGMDAALSPMAGR